MGTKKENKNGVGKEFVITREFAAPRELVFEAWTDSRHLAQWWGPKGFPIGCGYLPHYRSQVFRV